MRTSNGQGVGSNEHSVNTTNNTRNVSDVTQLTASQAEFLYLVECQGYGVNFANETLVFLPQFIIDSMALSAILRNQDDE